MRFVDLGTVSPEYSVCADRAVFESHLSGHTDNTLHIYTRDRPSISLGRFQSLADTVRDISDITVVRRMSGGGTIFSDPGQMTYALTARTSDLPHAREESFKKICSALVIMFGKLGVTTVHKPVNDILCNGRKISGSAQYRDGGSIMQHGTIILSVDNSIVEKHLISCKRTYDGLTSVKDVLGYVPSREIIVNALTDAFGEVFGTDIVHGELTSDEMMRIDELMNGGVE